VAQCGCSFHPLFMMHSWLRLWMWRVHCMVCYNLFDLYPWLFELFSDSIIPFCPPCLYQYWDEHFLYKVFVHITDFFSLSWILSDSLTDHCTLGWFWPKKEGLGISCYDQTSWAGFWGYPKGVMLWSKGLEHPRSSFILQISFEWPLLYSSNTLVQKSFETSLSKQIGIDIRSQGRNRARLRKGLRKRCTLDFLSVLLSMGSYAIGSQTWECLRISFRVHCNTIFWVLPRVSNWAGLGCFENHC
jgi:hypothetical protein